MEKSDKKSTALAQAPAASRTTHNLGVSGTARAGTASALADICFDLWSAERTAAIKDQLVGGLLAAVLDQAGGGVLLGLLGKCQIRGCDVHVLTLEHDIVRHLSTDAPTPTGFSGAREYWRAPHDAAVAVLVYSDHLDVVLLDGTKVRLASGGQS